MDKTVDYIQLIGDWFDVGLDGGFTHMIVSRDDNDEIRHRYIEPSEDFYEVMETLQTRDNWHVMESYSLQGSKEDQLGANRTWSLPPRDKVDNKLSPLVVELVKLVARTHGSYEQAARTLEAQLPNIDAMKLSDLRLLRTQLTDLGVPEGALIQKIKLRILDLTPDSE